MTQTTEQRLAAVERELSVLRVHAARLDVLVQVLLHANRSGSADTEQLARAVGVIEQAVPRSSRARLRLVDEAGSVDGQDLEEGLRRVRAGRADGR